MKLLLTSSGISNASIRDALVGLLGKPVAESSALFVPTAIYPFPGGAGKALQAISGNAKSPLCDLGWKSLGVLELTALPSIEEEVWAAAVRETDALLVWGGDPVYLGQRVDDRRRPTRLRSGGRSSTRRAGGACTASPFPTGAARPRSRRFAGT